MDVNRKEYRLGVLLVHGIGTQPSGDTLVRWGDVLLKTIRRATRDRVRVQINTACRSSEATPENPTTAVVGLTSPAGEKESWLFLDGWWADVFLSPSYRELVSWSLRAVPWAIAIHVAQNYWNAAEGEKPRRNVKHIAIAILQLLVGLALAPLFVILLALTLFLGLLPIPQMRSFILAIQGTLVSTVGDCLAFVESPMRAALIRTRVLNRLRWLKERCDHTIVIAHSQGAAVVLDALGGICEPSAKGPPTPDANLTASDLAPNTLITFGAGTNQLTSLKSLSTGLPNRNRMPTGNPAILVMGALFAIIGIGAWVFVAALSHRIDVQKVLQGAGLLVVVAACFGGIAAVTVALLNCLSKRRPALEKPKEWILGGVLVALLLGAFFIIERSKLPFEPANWFFYPIYFLIAGISVILSRKTRADVTTATAPSKVVNWYDFYASADPVPNGPTRIREPETNASRFQSIRISNLGSFFADHSAYWENLDAFVLPVIRACAETAGSPWNNELPRELPETNQRSGWRVIWLRLAKWTVYISSAVAGIALWIFHRDEVPVPFKLPSWLPALTPTAVRLAMFAAGTAIIAWFVSGIVGLIWNRWARAEQQLVLAHQGVDSAGYWRLVGLVFAVCPIIAFAWSAVTNQFPTLDEVNSSGKVVFEILLSVLVLVLLLTFFLRPGPRVPKLDPEPPANTHA